MKTVQGRNEVFRRAGVGWEDQGTVGAIWVISSEADQRGFGKWG